MPHQGTPVFTNIALFQSDVAPNNTAEWDRYFDPWPLIDNTHVSGSIFRPLAPNSTPVGGTPNNTHVSGSIFRSLAPNNTPVSGTYISTLAPNIISEWLAPGPQKCFHGKGSYFGTRPPIVSP